MPDSPSPFAPSPQPDNAATSPFDAIVSAPGTGPATPQFTTAFRGYDRDEVDEVIGKLTARLSAKSEEAAGLEERYRRAARTAIAQNRKTVERLEADLAAANAQNRDAAKALSDEQASATAAREQAERLKAELDSQRAEQAAQAAGGDDQVARLRQAMQELQDELTAANARAAKAEQRVQTLSDELVGAAEDTTNRHHFEEVLRVAEEQAGVLIRNATVQGDRLLEAAREEILNRRKEAQAEAAAILSQAQHEAEQVRLRIDTELTAHAAQLERESAHAAEKVSHAEQEAAAIRSEAEKGAAALRSMVARETGRDRAEAEATVRELRQRALEFEESLTRRQDDAQQEFLVLHNQAVAHAERITQDANEQVQASLEHAQRVSTKAEDFEKLMRAQAQQVEAEARVRAREHLDRARDKAQRIIDTVTAHTQQSLRDAEDRTRQLRWQQHQLTSFMAEVKELIRPEMPLGADDEASSPEAPATAAVAAEASADALDTADTTDTGAIQVLENAAEIVDAVALDGDEADDSEGDADGAEADDEELESTN